jgi:hypothetical protein
MIGVMRLRRLSTGDRAPYLKGWQLNRLSEAEIRKRFADQPRNIGIVLGDLSGGLVDDDLDCPEAVCLAPYLLPHTNCVFGRASNPASHYVYRVSNPGKRMAFTAGAGHGTIAEYRANGSMTVFPGSVHPSGEPIEFVTDGEPGEVDSDSLRQAVAKVTASSLIVRRWIDGQRHDTALALGGVLPRSQWPSDDATAFVKSICRVARDPETPPPSSCSR